LPQNTIILVTGGAGFIGANFIHQWIQCEWTEVVNLDKLTYAGNLRNLDRLQRDPRHILIQGDIGDRKLVSAVLRKHQPQAVVNFAAETHVDRSIHNPEAFIQTNVVGAFHLLDEVRGYWETLPDEDRARFRFLHVSTDEVYGSLEPHDAPFSEMTPYSPNSPYAASKAASDHFVRAYFHTYGLPTLRANCSNNYGPYQFPDKVIPLTILNAIAGKPLPIYGDGSNVRDWLYVDDHCTAVRQILEHGRPGETYNIGGRTEKRNIDLVKTICVLLDELHPDSPVVPHEKLIAFVKDRPGHDRRYAIDAAKVEQELGWMPTETFESGIRKTVRWYLDNQEWARQVTNGDYRKWVERQYGVTSDQSPVGGSNSARQRETNNKRS
jgi:dTDP-glucose 4,6-dehydratase